MSRAGDLVSASPYSLVWMSRGLGVVVVVVVVVGFEAVFVVFGMVDWVGWGDLEKNTPLYPMGFVGSELLSRMNEPERSPSDKGL